MKVSEVIKLLSKLPQEEVVYLLNGVSRGGPITPECFGWDTRHGMPPWTCGSDTKQVLNFQGPVKPVFCIYGE